MEGRVALAESTVNNARNAAFTDWRFQPLTAPEFEKIHIEISVLSPLRQIDDLADFVIGTHGIRLEKGRHAAVFLPQVAPEQGWDQRTTLEHLCRKAGMRADAWQRGATFKVFTPRCSAKNTELGRGASPESRRGDASPRTPRAGCGVPVRRFAADPFAEASAWLAHRYEDLEAFSVPSRPLPARCQPK
jgi:hypothetical protein